VEAFSNQHAQVCYKPWCRRCWSQKSRSDSDWFLCCGMAISFAMYVTFAMVLPKELSCAHSFLHVVLSHQHVISVPSTLSDVQEEPYMVAEFGVCPCTEPGLYEVAGFCVFAPTRPTFDPASGPAPAPDSTCGGCGEPACDGAHFLSLSPD
jgi:hypothetical protein